MRSRLLKIAGSEQGASLLEVALAVPFLMLVLAGVVGFGRAYYVANELAGAAEAGAVYGSQNITDTTGMVNAAELDIPNVGGLNTPTAAWGCECSDGSQRSVSCATMPASCSANVVYYATVTTAATYTPPLPWAWNWNGKKSIPSSMTISKSVTMRSASE
jgi:Flp pilus assembly protein TadG